MKTIELIELGHRLGITDDEAGDTNWEQYLSDRELAAAINRLRPGAGATVDEDLPEFCCPKCGWKYWGTVDLAAGTVECHRPGCGWTGKRNECGL
jgi:hypothetical protein